MMHLYDICRDELDRRMSKPVIAVNVKADTTETVDKMGVQGEEVFSPAEEMKQSARMVGTEDMATMHDNCDCTGGNGTTGNKRSK